MRSAPHQVVWGASGVPLSVLASNQFQEDMRRLAELKPLLPVVLLEPTKAVSTHWQRAADA